MRYILSAFCRYLLSLSVFLLLSACGTGSYQNDMANAPASHPMLEKNGKPSIDDLANDPLRFKGLTSAEVANLLGAATYRRRETPAEIWQYFGPGCVLDLFLYDENGIQRVSYAELRSRIAGQLPDAHCLPRIMAQGQPNS